MWDVVIAGAGPAGATAARELAICGFKVLLADRLDRKRHPTGEALPAATARLLADTDILIQGEIGPHIPSRGKLTCWSSEILTGTDSVSSPLGPDFRLDRGRFDDELRAMATHAGAIHRHAYVRDAERRDKRWVLKLDDNTSQEARWLIDATGRSSAVSRQISIKRSKGHKIVATYCEGFPTDDPRLNNIVIEAVRGGWWHATRLPSGASIVGIFTIPDIAVELHRDRKQWSDALVTTRHLREIVSGSDFNGVLHSHDASEGRLAIFQGEGWLACGDAAMSFDPIAGQGLHHAILNGAAAADAIRAANGTEPSSERSYSDGLEASWHTYRRRRIQTYRQERRWSRDPFWLKAHESPS